MYLHPEGEYIRDIENPEYRLQNVMRLISTACHSHGSGLLMRVFDLRSEYLAMAKYLVTNCPHRLDWLAYLESSVAHPVGSSPNPHSSRHNIRPLHRSPNRSHSTDSTNHSPSQIDSSPFVHQPMDTVLADRLLPDVCAGERPRLLLQFLIDRLAEKESEGKQREEQAGSCGVHDSRFRPGFISVGEKGEDAAGEDADQGRDELVRIVEGLPLLGQEGGALGAHESWYRAEAGAECLS